MKDEISLTDFDTENDVIDALEMTEIQTFDKENDEEVIEALDLIKVQDCDRSEGSDEGKSSLSLPITPYVKLQNTRA